MASGRQTIKQRISLEGGEEIRDQLKELGETGEKAFEQIRKAAVKADLAKFGNSLGKFGKDLATVGRRAALAFGAISAAAGAAGAAMFGLAQSAGEAADKIGKAAQKTGLQVEAFQKLAHAAEMSDVGPEQFIAGMSRLNRAIVEAAEAGSKATDKLGKSAQGAARNITQHLGHSVETFDKLGVRVTRFGDNVEKASNKAQEGSEGVAAAFIKLGVRVKDASGKLRTNEEILFDLAEAFSRLPDGAEKSALVMEIFGRSGAEMLPFLNEGAEGIKKLGDRFVELGGVFTKEQTVIGDALGDALDEMKVAIGGIRNQLGILFAPAVTVAAEALTEAIVGSKDAIIEFGRVVMLNGVMIVRDLINALAGNDAAVRQPWILVWRDAIVSFGRDTKAVIETVILPLFRAVREGAQLVTDAINKVFGTEMSAGQLLIGAALLKLLGVFKLVRSGAVVLVAGLRLIGSALMFAFGGGIMATIARFGGLLASAGTAAGGFWGILVRGATVFLGLVAGLVSWPVLLGAAVVAAGAAIFVFWDEIVAGAQAAIAKIQQFFSAENLARVFDGLRIGAEQAGKLFVDVLAISIEAVGALFRGLGTIVTGFVSGVIAEITALAAQLLPAWSSIETAGSSVWGAISGAATTAWDTVVSGASTIFTRISGVFATGLEIVRTAFQPIADLVSSIWSGATAGIAAAAQAITDAIANASSLAGDLEGAAEMAASLVKPFQDASAEIDRIFAAIQGMAVRGFNAIRNEVGSIAQSIEQMIARILAALRQAAAAAARLKAQASSSSKSSSSGASTFAGGGSVRGAGTGTSDSIPAWLSNGEFVIKAAAVRKFGAGFFASLNSMRMPKGFSVGGMVSGFERSMSSLMPVQRFANGGPVLAPAGGGISGRPINVSFEGETFAMVADESVAEKLQRFATGKAMRSTGRKPGWR